MEGLTSRKGSELDARPVLPLDYHFPGAKLLSSSHSVALTKNKIISRRVNHISMSDG